LIPHKSGDRVKTNRRDATMLALFIPCSRRRACAAPNDIGRRAAGGDSRFSEMMELGRWGDERW
jgi:hypothetical protein